MAEYFENRGTLRELSKFTMNGGRFDFTTTYNENRKKDIHWLSLNSATTMNEPIKVFVDNVFWKNTTVSFMVKRWYPSSGSDKKILLSYVDNEGKNYFEIYTKNNKIYLASQLVEIDISAFRFSQEHLFTVTRDWGTGKIQIWEDKTQIISEYFTDSNFAVGNEDRSSVLANEDNSAIIVMEPSIINRGSLNRNINLCFYGSDELGVTPLYYMCIADFHIWDWAFDQDEVEEIYDNSMITMAVDRLTRYLGEFKEVPPLARLGDSFMWVGVSNDLFQNGKVYWLTTGGWSILNNNAEYSAT